MKIVFMDIDLKSYVGSFYCSSLDDYVDVKGRFYVMSKIFSLCRLTKSYGSRTIMHNFSALLGL